MFLLRSNHYIWYCVKWKSKLSISSKTIDYLRKLKRWIKRRRNCVCKYFDNYSSILAHICYNALTFLLRLTEQVLQFGEIEPVSSSIYMLLFNGKSFLSVLTDTTTMLQVFWTLKHTTILLLWDVREQEISETQKNVCQWSQRQSTQH